MQSPLYRSYMEILCKNEVLSVPGLTGPMQGMYPILDQCRLTLLGQDDPSAQEDPSMRRWLYSLTVPLMLVGQTRAQRSEVHLTAALCTPFSEEKMRYGCQLHCDCDVFPRCAAELMPGSYRVAFDAQVSLYAELLRCGCA